VKISDRLVLGGISGILGNLAMLLTISPAIKMKLAEFDGPTRTAGIFLPLSQVNKPMGQAVGYIANNVIAATLGTAAVYILSVTGKDKAVLKGSGFGLASWLFLYGMLGNVGVTAVKPSFPKTIISQAVSHMVFGAVTAYAATKIGNEDLFNGNIPLRVGVKKIAEQQEKQTEQQVSTVEDILSEDW
jgi:hypothetical protein